ncbi:hypothetical protein IG631_23713 [Alternaria alternata]|nr:hypothetical protein IG631_23713 [Alternaria alternata]
MATRWGFLDDRIAAFTHHLQDLKDGTSCLCWQQDCRRCYYRGCGGFHRSLSVRQSA